MTLDINYFTERRVPLQRLGWLIFCNMIIGTPKIFIKQQNKWDINNEERI